MRNFNANSFSNSPETYRFVVKQKQTMFEQYIGDGASTFITIIAVLIGFAAALGYLDFLKVKKEQKKD
jgi:hypothetical protein